MKNIFKVILIGLLSLTMLACQETENKSASEENREMVVVTTTNNNEEIVEVEIPKNPKRVVVLDYLALDQIASWGLEDTILGTVKGSVPSHLRDITSKEEIKDLGTLKDINMEQLMSLQPDVIFISGRLKAKYKEISIIAPTVVSSIDYKAGAVESYKELARRNAKIFGMEEKVEAQIVESLERVDELKEKASGKTALIGMTVGGSIHTLGNNSRGSIITNEIGFKNVSSKIDSTHGNSSSFEYVLKANPDYIFVLDRDSAIGTEGASPAKQLMDNEIIHETKAYKNNSIIYLTPDVWYLSEGGIKSMEIMLDDIEGALQ